MATQIKILGILKMSHKDYSNFIFTYYMNYCMKYMEYGLPLESLIKNDHLLVWYKNNWRGMVEKPFLKHIHDYLDNEILEPNTYQELLSTHAEDIEEYYPSVIFKMIKEDLKPQSKTNAIND